MGRLRAPLVLLLAVFAAIGLAACGGSGDLLSGQAADAIDNHLDRVRTLVAEGDCAGAEDAVGEVSEEVAGLNGVDARLKAALREGAARLADLVSSCEAEALQAEEAENEAAEEEAEEEEREAVEAEEEEFAAEEEQLEKREEKEEEKEEKKAEQEESAEEGEEEAKTPAEGTTPESAEGFEEGKGPPAETPSGNEPPAGGVGPGAVVE